MKSNDYVSHKMSWSRCPLVSRRRCITVITTLHWWFCTHHIIKQQSVCFSWSLMVFECSGKWAAGECGWWCSGFGGRHSKEIERKVRIICKSITGNWSRTVSASICIRIESLALHLQRLKPHQPEKCTLRIFTTTNTIRFPWKNNPPSNKRHFRCHQTKDTPLMELQLENAASKSKITCCC